MHSESALEFLHSNQPDLVLLSLALPHQGGHKLFHQISLDYTSLNLILLCENESALMDVIGARNVIYKPVITDSVLVTVDRILDNPE